MSKVLDHEERRQSEGSDGVDRAGVSNCALLVVLTRGGSKLWVQLEGLAASVAALPACPARAETAPSVAERQQRRLTGSQVDELVQQYRLGADMQVLAERWDLHRTTVAGPLRRAGVELRRQGVGDHQLAESVRLYAEGWSCQQLAERYGCTAETVRQRLKTAGVRLRKPWERI